MPHPAHWFRSSFIWKFAIATALVALGDWLFFQRGSFGSTIGAYALVLAIGLVSGHSGVRRDPRAWLATAAAAVFALALAYDPGLLAWTLFWSAIGIAALLPRTAAFDDGWRWLQRLAFHALRSPVAPLLDYRRMLKARSRRVCRGYARRPLMPMLALPLLGTLIFLLLFAAANPVIAEMIYAVHGPDLGELNLTRPLLWFMLFAMAWSMVRPRLPRALMPTFDGSGDLPLPGVSPASITLSLIAFNLVFALQNLMDIVYLWGEARLPGAMTMADYAHRGAYPLIGTALLAALFVLVTLRPGSATARVPAIRWLVLVWVAQNIFLVASSIERMVDYVGSYSLTALRIVVLGWMALVAFGLAAICWRMLAGKSAGWLINTNLAAALCLLTAASFADLGATAAWWNVRHAHEAGGKAVNLDLCYLGGLGSSSLLPLIALEQNPRLTPAYREKVQALRQGLYRDLAHDLDHGSWTFRGERRFAQAQRELAAMAPAQIAAGERNCDGSLYVRYVAPPAPIQLERAPVDPVVPAAAAAPFAPTSSPH